MAKKLIGKMKPLEAADPSWSQWVRSAKDVSGRDVPLLIRGNHRKPGSVIVRRFLTAVAGDMAPSRETLGAGSGRLAES